MTRENFIENLKQNYTFVSLLSKSSDYSIYRFRHNTLGKDVILRSYKAQISAYYKLLDVCSDNLAEIYDVLTLDDGMIVLEEYIDGITLAQSMEVKKYQYNDAKKVLQSVCNALSVLHKSDIVHRDIKPENILIDKNNRVVLIDFNASRTIKQTSKDTCIMGTVGYVSPEQLGLSQTDARSDIYTMGVLLNVLLTGDHPSVKAAVGKAASIIRKCTNINPKSRYQTVEQLYNAL